MSRSLGSCTKKRSQCICSRMEEKLPAIINNLVTFKLQIKCKTVLITIDIYLERINI